MHFTSIKFKRKIKVFRYFESNHTICPTKFSFSNFSGLSRLCIWSPKGVVFVVAGESMVGQSILLSAAVGDEIRLYNFGGDIYEDESTSDDFLHFVGVLLYSSDRS